MRATRSSERRMLSSISAFLRSNSSRLIFIGLILSYDDQPHVRGPFLDVGQCIEYSDDIVAVERRFGCSWPSPKHELIVKSRGLARKMTMFAAYG